MWFNLDFANNTILSCYFFFFLIINLYFLIPAVITNIFNPIAELVILIGIPRKEVKAEIEIHEVWYLRFLKFSILIENNAI